MAEFVVPSKRRQASLFCLAVGRIGARKETSAKPAAIGLAAFSNRGFTRPARAHLFVRREPAVDPGNLSGAKSLGQ